MKYLAFSMYDDWNFFWASSLGWNLWSPRFCKTSVQALLVFRVFVREVRCRYALMLFVLFLLDHLMFCLCIVCLVFWLLCGIGIFFADPIYLVFCKSFTFYRHVLLWLGKPFMILLNIFSSICCDKCHDPKYLRRGNG